MILFVLATLLLLKDPKRNQKVDKTLQKIRSSTQDISSIHFSEIESKNNEEDAIAIVLEKVEAVDDGKSKLKSFPFYSKDDKYISEDCSNCIKVLFPKAKFYFRAIRKSITNKVKFYQSSENSCSAKEAQLTFYDENTISYTSEIFDLTKTTLNTYNLKQNVTFDRVHVSASSGNNQILCLSEILLLNE